MEKKCSITGCANVKLEVHPILLILWILFMFACCYGVTQLPWEKVENINTEKAVQSK